MMNAILPTLLILKISEKIQAIEKINNELKANHLLYTTQI